MLIDFFVIAVLGSMAGLVLFEIIEEARGSQHRLQDKYHP